MSPKIKVIGDRLYQLSGDYSVYWQHETQWRKITVPDGFVCDGNSVPWFGRPLIPGDWTLGIEAVLVHDFLYHRKGRLHEREHLVEADAGFWVDPLHIGDGFRRAWTRHDADRLFGRLMREAGVPKARRRAAYRAVRIAVWQGWDAYPWSPTDEL
jgi:hypothetical protein